MCSRGNNFFCHPTYLGRLVDPCADGLGLFSEASEDISALDNNQTTPKRGPARAAQTPNLKHGIMLAPDGACLRDKQSKSRAFFGNSTEILRHRVLSGLVFDQSGSGPHRFSHSTSVHEWEPNDERLRELLGRSVSVSFGSSRVTGWISCRPSLDQSREQRHADTEVEASRVFKHWSSQSESRSGGPKKKSGFPRSGPAVSI